jgi:hypothetical protein
MVSTSLSGDCTSTAVSPWRRPDAALRRNCTGERPAPNRCKEINGLSEHLRRQYGPRRRNKTPRAQPPTPLPTSPSTFTRSDRPSLSRFPGLPRAPRLGPRGMAGHTSVLIHRTPRAATVGVHESLGPRGVSQFPGDPDRQGERVDGHVSLVDEKVGVALEPLAFEIREPDLIIRCADVRSMEVFEARFASTSKVSAHSRYRRIRLRHTIPAASAEGGRPPYYITHADFVALLGS